MTDSEHSQEFLDWISAFSRRLAAHKRAVYKVQYWYMAFGSWVIEVGSLKNRVVVGWDGKVFTLSADRAVYDGSGSVPDTRRISETVMRDASQELIFATAEGLVLAN